MGLTATLPDIARTWLANQSRAERKLDMLVKWTIASGRSGRWEKIRREFKDIAKNWGSRKVTDLSDIVMKRHASERDSELQDVHVALLVAVANSDADAGVRDSAWQHAVGM